MPDNDSGVVFTQDGVPVQGAADYQKVLDTRWRFMEVEMEQQVRFSLPAVTAVTFANRYFEKTLLLRHGLGFIPLFETDLDAEALGATVWADEDKVFIRRLVSTSNLSAVAQTLARIRVYNLPILESYEAPKQFIAGSSSPEASVGMQFLEESGGVDLGDVSSTGFSVDTRKKILSVHRHGRALINDYSGRQAAVSAIDTGTDTLTVGAKTGAPYSTDFTWTSQLGQAVVYSPNNFVTFPSPLTTGTTYYLIPQTATTVKLATSYANALTGAAINLTTAGSLPGTLLATSNPSLEENAIYHDVGYPPTFILAETNWDDAYFAQPETAEYIGPRISNPPTRMTADKEYIRFFGVQTTFAGRFGYVVLKDPVEIAK